MDCLMMKTKIARGTTPTLRFTFNTVNPNDIEVAFLVFKQSGKEIIDLPIDTAEIGSNYISWTVPQQESLKLVPNKFADIYCDWRTYMGLRGQSRQYRCEIEEAGKEEVI